MAAALLETFEEAADETNIYVLSDSWAGGWEKAMTKKPKPKESIGESLILGGSYYHIYNYYNITLTHHLFLFLYLCYLVLLASLSFGRRQRRRVHQRQANCRCTKVSWIFRLVHGAWDSLPTWLPAPRTAGMRQDFLHAGSCWRSEARHVHVVALQREAGRRETLSKFS